MSSPIRNTLSSRISSSRRASRRASRIRISTIRGLLRDEIEQCVEARLRAVFRKVHRPVDDLFDAVGNLFELRLIQLAGLLHLRLQLFDTIFRAVLRNFILEAVELR